MGARFDIRFGGATGEIGGKRSAAFGEMRIECGDVAADANAVSEVGRAVSVATIKEIVTAPGFDAAAAAKDPKPLAAEASKRITEALRDRGWTAEITSLHFKA